MRLNLAERAARSEYEARPEHPWTLGQWTAYYRVLFVIVGGVVGGLLIGIIIGLAQ